MTRIPLRSAFAAILILASTAFAQNPPATPATPAKGTAAPAAKPKPFSSSDTKTLLEIADSMQFQMNMAQRVSSKFRETDPALVGFAGRMRKEATELWTPMVDMATAHGVEGKKIPLDMSKADKASVAKLGAIKDEKKWTVAFFEHFAKVAKKNAATATADAKNVGDPELKAWVEKATAMLQSQSELLETKHQELKSTKK